MSSHPNGALRPRRLPSVFVAMGILGSAIGGCAIAADPTGPQASTCALDPGVVGCAVSSTGYSCTGSSAPSQNSPTLTCGLGVPGVNGATNYCCTKSTDVCSQNPEVAGRCPGGGAGYSCTGDAAPNAIDAFATCTLSGSNIDGLTNYCCTAGPL